MASTPSRPPIPLLPNQESLQARALILYSTILEDCKRAKIPLSKETGAPALHLFFDTLHKHCPDSGKSNVLFVVLHALFPPLLPQDFTSYHHRAPDVILPRAEAWLHPSFNPKERNSVYQKLQILADDLVRGFFVPLQAAAGRPPAAVSPLICERSHGDVGNEQGTPARLDGLRQSCLRRDGNRCVISRRIDWVAQNNYNEMHPANLIDEDPVDVEVAHIIPHSLNTLSANGTLGPTRTYAWRVMNMFDPGISSQLASDAIDSPRNAMSLDSSLLKRFGRLKWYLEPVGPPGSHTYTVCTICGQRLQPWLCPPTSVVSFNTTSDVPPPDPRFLAFHRACCLIMSMSGAGACADEILRDMTELAGNGVLAADGSSDLAMFWMLREVRKGVLAY